MYKAFIYSNKNELLELGKFEFESDALSAINAKNTQRKKVDSSIAKPFLKAWIYEDGVIVKNYYFNKRGTIAEDELY